MEDTEFNPQASFSPPKQNVPVKPAVVEHKKYEKPVKSKCELTGEEVRGLYGAIKGLHESTANNINIGRGDLGPLKRELGKIKWYDCTEWHPNGGACTYSGCDGGLH